MTRYNNGINASTFNALIVKIRTLPIMKGYERKDNLKAYSSSHAIIFYKNPFPE